MDKLPTILMIASAICLCIAIALLIGGAIGHDIARQHAMQACTDLGGVAIVDYYDSKKVLCMRKDVFMIN
jgi:hypothetical protein